MAAPNHASIAEVHGLGSGEHEGQVQAALVQAKGTWPPVYQQVFGPTAENFMIVNYLFWTSKYKTRLKIIFNGSKKF